MSSEDSPKQNDYDWEQMESKLEQLRILASTKGELDRSSSSETLDYNPLNKEPTTRTNVRAHDAQIEWSNTLLNTDWFNSREMLFSACIAYAHSSQDKFIDFITDFAFAQFVEESGGSVQPEDTTNTNSESNAPDSSNEDSGPNFEPPEEQKDSDNVQKEGF